MLFSQARTVHPEPVEGYAIKPFMLRQAQHEREDLQCLHNYRPINKSTLPPLPSPLINKGTHPSKLFISES